MSGPDALASRLGALDWAQITTRLGAEGAATTGPILTPGECADLRALYADDNRFRSRIEMRRHGFGSGEYKYLAYPLPDLVQTLRAAVYPRLVPLANAWMAALGRAHRYPAGLEAFLADCHAAGQTRPTPLLLRYGPGDHNCLHQDLYGPLAFPIQMVILLSAPETDFTGGALALTEQRPRMQSRVEVLPLGLGEAAFFAVNERPRQGSRGMHAVRMRHGVGTVRSGTRQTLGVIFHDAA